MNVAMLMIAAIGVALAANQHDLILLFDLDNLFSSLLVPFHTNDSSNSNIRIVRLKSWMHAPIHFIQYRIKNICQHNWIIDASIVLILWKKYLQSSVLVQSFDFFCRICIEYRPPSNSIWYYIEIFHESYDRNSLYAENLIFSSVFVEPVINWPFSSVNVFKFR